MNFKKILEGIGLVLVILVIGLAGFLWLGVYHPAEVEEMAVTCPDSAPQVQPGQSLKVLTWNVQTMSGKNYVFWSDLPTNDGPDDQPSPEDITLTLEEVARAIIDENPDIILIQEIDNGAARTYNEDQLARLLDLLPDEYACSTSTFSWKAAYVPHPRIKGSVGWMEAIVSKYQISTADRHRLVISESSWLETQFRIKPAILASHLPMVGGGEFVAATLHFDIYVPGNNAKDLQVEQVNQFLANLNASGTPWVLGGDFNLLPYDDAAYNRLLPSHQPSYNSVSEIKPLFDAYLAVPSQEEVTGENYAAWLTRWPNDPAISGPDRTLDYIFLPPSIALGDHYVRQADTLVISDHLPVVAVFELP
ncbi:MAG TPA: endonuclease/exonuclease/phosphatase family protein [Anaerolineales bacterium]|nr:endonuclease/exonuclease/phosphatase family protein [Anaerolineales bacterium]